MKKRHEKMTVLSALLSYIISNGNPNLQSILNSQFNFTIAID